MSVMRNETVNSEGMERHKESGNGLLEQLLAYYRLARSINVFVISSFGIAK